MDTQKIADVLKKIDPFNTLGEQILSEISTRAEIVNIAAGTYIFKQGESGLETLFIIVSGLVEILVSSDKGNETFFGFRKPGEFFSETGVLSSQPYTASARAREDLVCIKIYRQDLETLIYSSPEFSSYFNELLTDRMRRLYEQIQIENSLNTTTCMGIPLFRKRISEIMAPRVVTCRSNDQVADAARQMAKAGISSSVVLDSKKKPVGMLTMPAIVKNLIIDCTCPVNNCTAQAIMDPLPQTISPNAFTGPALVALTQQQTKYLLVMDEEKLVGMVTAIDLIKSRTLGNLTFLQDIEVHTTVDGLAKVAEEINGVLDALVMEGAKVPDILEVMSGLHERLIRAVITVCESQMIDQGFGPPPVDYCWINMGSDARHEQTLRTDQDNALIYADSEDIDINTIDAYFETLADKIVHGLDKCGFDLCTGNVMATNTKWRRSLSQWCQHIENWSSSLDPEHTIDMTILLDFRPVWGNHALARMLWDMIFKVFDNPEKMNHMLTQEDLRFDIPLNFFGNIRPIKTGPYKDQINIKTGGLVHLVNGVRLFAINSKISETSTLGRINQLEEQGIFSKKRAQFLKTAFETLVMFRIRTNLEKINKNQEPDNYIDPSALTKGERMLLKDALYSVSQMQKLIQNRFTQIALNFFS